MNDVTSLTPNKNPCAHLSSDMQQLGGKSPLARKFVLFVHCDKKISKRRPPNPPPLYSMAGIVLMCSVTLRPCGTHRAAVHHCRGIIIRSNHGRRASHAGDALPIGTHRTVVSPAAQLSVWERQGWGEQEQGMDGWPALELSGELPATFRLTVAYPSSSGSERSVGETGTPFRAVSAAERLRDSCSPL